jgi:hypothetical protein
MDRDNSATVKTAFNADLRRLFPVLPPYSAVATAMWETGIGRVSV